MKAFALIATGMLATAIAGAVPIAASAQESIATAPAERVMDLWHEENSACRGGSGDDARTWEACDRREIVGRALQDRGWCYGKEGEAGYQHEWHRCGPHSTRF